jgi:hypothetical protein
MFIALAISTHDNHSAHGALRWTVRHLAFPRLLNTSVIRFSIVGI